MSARAVLAHWLGWRTAIDPGTFKNRGTHRGSRATEALRGNPEAYAHLIRLNRLDLAFHRAAVRRFPSDLIEVGLRCACL